MPDLTNLKMRVQHAGGSPKERMSLDKLRSLKQALLYSYQAETAVLADGREFKCLINPNKLSMELDDKMLSIPFMDVPLNREAQEEIIGVKPGDIITWKENNTHWLVYNQYLQEEAYFRGLMRQCDTEVDINGQSYWVYIKGPSEKGIDWSKSKHFMFNNLNYTLEMYISKDENSLEFFHRFKILNILGKSWEVQAVDNITTDGIIEVYLKEYYSEEIEPEPPKEDEEEVLPPTEEPIPSIAIVGKTSVYPYDVVMYFVNSNENGFWSLSNKRARILRQSATFAEVEITSGKSGDITLLYHGETQDAKLNISILSI